MMDPKQCQQGFHRRQKVDPSVEITLQIRVQKEVTEKVGKEELKCRYVMRLITSNL